MDYCAIGSTSLRNVSTVAGYDLDLTSFKDVSIIVYCDKLIGDVECATWTRSVEVYPIPGEEDCGVRVDMDSLLIVGSMVIKPKTGCLVSGDSVKELNLFGRSSKGVGEYKFKNVKIYGTSWNPKTKEMGISFSCDSIKEPH